MVNQSFTNFYILTTKFRINHNIKHYVIAFKYQILESDQQQLRRTKASAKNKVNHWFTLWQFWVNQWLMGEIWSQRLPRKPTCGKPPSHKGSCIKETLRRGCSYEGDIATQPRVGEIPPPQRRSISSQHPCTCLF